MMHGLPHFLLLLFFVSVDGVLLLGSLHDVLLFACSLPLYRVRVRLWQRCQKNATRWRVLIDHPLIMGPGGRPFQSGCWLNASRLNLWFHSSGTRLPSDPEREKAMFIP